MDENFHVLSILVELDLYEVIRSIREENLPNASQRIQKEIELFEKNLPEYLKGLKGSHDFIIQKIDKIDKEIAKTKNSKNMRNKKSRDDEQER